MADNMRWRYGDTNPVVAPVDSATVIEIGDLVYLDTDDAKPAGYDANGDGTGDLWNTNLATTQEAFHDKFLGVAMQRSRAGDTEAIRVATTGVFEFDCVSATYELGTLVSPDQTGGNNLRSQQVRAVTGSQHNLALGRVTKRLGTAGTRVLVDVQSTVMTGGAQAMA
jgi:hypothetical protein